MKKMIFGLLTGVTIATASTISFGATGTVNTDNSRVRSKAASDSTVLTLLSINDKVEIIEESGEWYKVSADNETGYVSKSLIDVEETTKKEEIKEVENTKEEKQEETTETPKEETEKQEIKEAKSDVTKINEGYEGNLESEVTIKILPSINSTNIAKIEKSTKIKVIEVINEWCHLETDSFSGWARKSIVEGAISVSSNDEQKDETEETETADTVESKEEKIGYVNVESVNIRKEKSTTAEILDGLAKNTKVTILSEEDGWYKVQVDNMTGYVSKQYISDKKVEDVTSRAADSARKIEQSKQTDEEETQNSTANSSTGNLGAEVVAFAKQYLGYNYVSGGSKPSTGFDCSGFTSYVYSNFGVSLNRASTAQANDGKSISKSELQPGDLLIFNNSSNSSVGHVGIYTGNDQFIHAANGSKGVITTSLSSSYYEARYVDARRVLP